MFPELRAGQIEVPGDVLEMREGSGEAPAHEYSTRGARVNQGRNWFSVATR
jgi:hypothetical protein